MSQVELQDLKNRVVAGLVAEAAIEWRLLTYGKLRGAVLERAGVELKGTIDEWHRLGAVSSYMLEHGLPMVSAIVVNENHGLLPGKAFVDWLVEERTGQEPNEVPEDRKRRIVSDEQLATFQKATEIREAVRLWTI